MSTFSAPASATSGLAAYDLEGKKPKNEKTLIIKRAVRNGDEVVAWAKAAGFTTTLPADDMHVTIAYSKSAVDWDKVPRSDLPILRIVGGERKMKRLGKAGEAAVLGIQSDELARRHNDVRAAGASYDYPEYQPHITISYAAEGIDVAKIVPLGATIELGPEEWDETKENWMASVAEKMVAPVLAAGFALVTNEGTALFLKRSDDGDHAGEWCFPGGKIEAGETALAAAMRETFEEVGLVLKPADERAQVCRIVSAGVDFTTFFQRVEEFEPKLDHEHVGYRWAPIEVPPQPLHPGVRSALALVISQATELTMKVAGGDTTNVEKSDAGDIEMNNLSLFVQLRKVDAKQRIVYGTAVAEVPDRSGEIFDYASSKKEFEKWSSDIEKSTDGKSKGNVRAMHGKVAAGKLTEIGFDDVRKCIDVAAKIVDDDEWKKVEEGVYTGFSIGGSYLKRWTDGELKRYTARPAEVSLVDLPCVPTATFSMLKADGSEELRKFHKPAEPAVLKNEDVAARATDLAKAAGDAGAWLSHIEEARKQLEAELTKAAEEIEKAAEVAKTTPDDVEQVWVSKRLPGQSFQKKGDLAKALTDLAAKEAAAVEAAPVLDALKAAVGDVKAPKADEEKVATAADLDEALKAYGSGYTAKRQIVKLAKVLNLVDKLPEGWVAKAVGDEMEKGASLYTISALARMLACVEECEGGVEQGFGTALPKELTDRFGTALVMLGDIVSDVLDVVLAGIKEEEASEAANTATKSAELIELIKRGARHSKADKAVLKSIHDQVVSLGGEDICKGPKETQTADHGHPLGGQDVGNAGEHPGTPVKAASAEDLAKAAEIAAENEQLKAASTAHGELLKDIKAGIDAMTAKMATLETENAELKQKVEKVSEGQGKMEVDLSAIRYTPAPVPHGTFRAIEKGAPIPDFSEISNEELRRRGNIAQASRLAGR